MSAGENNALLEDSTKPLQPPKAKRLSCTILIGWEFWWFLVKKLGNISANNPFSCSLEVCHFILH